MSNRIAVAITLQVMLVMSFATVALSKAGCVEAQQEKAAQARAQYICIMDSDIKSRKPGKCPKCGMALRLVKADSKANKAGAAEQDMPAEADSPIKPQIPDVTVYDQDGRKLSFYTDLVKGKTVAINFMFTTCTTICPPLAATFRNVQREMKERIGRDVQLISVSVDPTTDVPERLKGFLKKFNAGPGWSFITGDKFEIDRLLKSLGAFVSDKNDHTPMILIGNDAGDYWTRTYGLAPASAIVKIINEAASKSAGKSGRARLTIEAIDNARPKAKHKE